MYTCRGIKTNLGGGKKQIHLAQVANVGYILLWSANYDRMRWGTGPSPARRGTFLLRGEFTLYMKWHTSHDITLTLYIQKVLENHNNLKYYNGHFQLKIIYRRVDKLLKHNKCTYFKSFYLAFLFFSRLYGV